MSRDFWDFYGPYQISHNKLYFKGIYRSFDLANKEDKEDARKITETEVLRFTAQLQLFTHLSTILEEVNTDA